jgi:hypothetical protein
VDAVFIPLRSQRKPVQPQSIIIIVAIRETPVLRLKSSTRLSGTASATVKIEEA